MSTEQRQDETWATDDAVTNHAEGDLPDDIDFFVAPPEEIGHVTSAYSTLRLSKQPWSPNLRALLILAVAAIGIGVGLLLGSFWDDIPAGWWLLFPLVAGGIGALIAWASTRFTHTCTFVGTEGVARFRCSGTRENLTVDEVLRFKKAAELRTGQTRRYVNGAYQGTDYNYTWTDDEGRRIFTISGTYHSQQGTPPEVDPFHFACAAELAWSKYMLDRVEIELREKGAIYFSLGGRDWVSIGPGRIDLSVGGQTSYCEADEIRSVSIQQGVFTVKRTDAKEGWFSSQGVFKFNYAALANAQLFLFVLDKLTGLRVR